DAVHAAGCLVFALAFAPALIHSISRFATRLDVTWVPPGSAIVPVLLVLALSGWIVARPAPAAATNTPLGYLVAAQNTDGGLGSAPGQSSSDLFSGWAALGVAAAGENPQRLHDGGASLTDYLASGGASDPGS